MEEEMEALERDVKVYDDSYGDNMLNLTGAKAYIKRLRDDAKILGSAGLAVVLVTSRWSEVSTTSSLLRPPMKNSH